MRGVPVRPSDMRARDDCAQREADNLGRGSRVVCRALLAGVVTPPAQHSSHARASTRCSRFNACNASISTSTISVGVVRKGGRIHLGVQEPPRVAPRRLRDLEKHLRTRAVGRVLELDEMLPRSSYGHGEPVMRNHSPVRSCRLPRPLHTRGDQLAGSKPNLLLERV
jgi:hypothetical protein